MGSIICEYKHHVGKKYTPSQWFPISPQQPETISQDRDLWSVERSHSVWRPTAGLVGWLINTRLLNLIVLDSQVQDDFNRNELTAKLAFLTI